jgi:signal transduction histidine kinase
VRLTPNLNTAACLAGIALTGCAIVGIETYVWLQIDNLRRGADTVVTPSALARLHNVETWSCVVELALGALLGVLIYLGIVSPLRRQLRQSEHIIARQEKLSALGVLAAGVAHEIRNPLTSIKVRLFTQQQLLAKGSEEFEDNVFLAGEITRLENIVNDVIAFARPSDPQFVSLKATRPMRELVPLIQPELRAVNIVLKEEYLADPCLQADADQLRQVLINLVKNAADAIGKDGAITLRTRIETRGRGTGADARVILEVSDTGPGIPPDVQKRLFDPFFTTKASGTGLGLSIAARILEKHDGMLEYSTELNRGTTFRLVLPMERR